MGLLDEVVVCIFFSCSLYEIYFGLLGCLVCRYEFIVDWYLNSGSLLLDFWGFFCYCRFVMWEYWGVLVVYRIIFLSVGRLLFGGKEWWFFLYWYLFFYWRCSNLLYRLVVVRMLVSFCKLRWCYLLKWCV